MKVRWIRSPPYLHLVPIGYGFGISFVHIRNFFIATDVLLQKKPFQCEHPCILPARGGTKTPDDTTRNIHFYDENVNDESKTVIEERFL